MANFDFITSWFRHTLLTSDKPKIARWQVDQGNTGFFDGREFRYFRELSIATSNSLYIRVIVGTDGIILKKQKITVDTGAVRFRAWRDAAVSGATFIASASPTGGLFPNNGLPSAPAYAMLTDITEYSALSTAISGGTVSEVGIVRSAGATAQRSSVGEQLTTDRGVPPGTYILQFENIGNDTVSGDYSLIFEERFGQG